MRNLKKVLALVLALVMSMSLVTIANASDFADADDITYDEAVDVLTALGVIEGVGNNTFNPTGNVTRAQMAKMITIVTLGNVSADAFLGTTTDLTDINGHWAEAYIKYCYSQGIISGKGAGIFDPNANVTCAEAAKMLLVAIGYNSDVQGYTGAQWAINVQRDATTSKFYKDMAVPATQDLTRDQAAQLIYNAIQATMIEKTSTVDRVDGSITDTYAPYLDGRDLLSETFDGAVELGYMTGYTYDEVKGLWSYTFNGDASDANNILLGVQNDINTQDAIGYTTAGYSDVTLKSSVDYTSLFGHQVKVIYNTEESDVIYGIYTNDSSVMVEGFYGDITASNLPATTATEIKIGGVTYKLDNQAQNINVVFEQACTDTAQDLDSITSLTAANTYYSYKMIDNDGDNKINTVIVTPFVVGKVTYVGNDSITVSAKVGNDATITGNFDLDDVVVYDGIAKDDYVMAVRGTYAPKGETTYTKLDIASGTITGVRDTDGDGANEEFEIDGNWYTKEVPTTLNSGDTVSYIALGSVLYYAEVTSGSFGTDAVAVVYNIADKTPTGIVASHVEVGLLKADGTKAVGQLVEINGYELETGDTVATSVTGVVDAVGNTDGTENLARIDAVNGELVKYEVDSDGNIHLWTIDAGYYDPNTKVMGFDGTLAAGGSFNNTTDEVAGYELADDAVVFVVKGTDAKVYTGREMKNTIGNFGAANAGNTAYASGLYAKTNGFTYAQVVVLQADANWPGITTGANYGYLLADSWTAKEDGVNYRYFKYWDGANEVTAKEKNKTDISTMKKGDIITFDYVEDGVIKNVSEPDMKLGAVTGWDGDSKITISGDSSDNNKVTDSTVVLYVDSEKKTGVAGGEISEAVDLANDGTVDENVLYLAGGERTYSLIVVDVNHKMIANYARSLNAASIPGANAAAKVTYLEGLLANEDVVINGDLNISGQNIDLQGNKLTVEGNLTAQSIVAGDASDELVVDGNLTLSGDASDNAATVVGTVTVDGNLVVAEDSDVNVTGGTLNVGAFPAAATAGNVFATGASTLIIGDVKYLGGSDAIFSVDAAQADSVEVHITPNGNSVALTLREVNKGHMADGTGGLVVTLQNDLDLSACGIDRLIVTNDLELRLATGKKLVFSTDDALTFKVSGCSISNIDASDDNLSDLGNVSVSSNAITSGSWAEYTATGAVTLTGKA